MSEAERDGLMLFLFGSGSMSDCTRYCILTVRAWSVGLYYGVGDRSGLMALFRVELCLSCRRHSE